MSYTMPTSAIAEVQSYPKETLHKLGFQAKRQCRVIWADRYAWASWFFYTPDANVYPYFVAAGLPTESAIGTITIEPDITTRLTHGTTGTAPEACAVYTHAILTLYYESAKFDLDNLLIEELIPRTESVGITNYVRRGTRTVAIPDVLHIPGYTYQLTYPRRSTMPSATMYLPGMVNLDVYHAKMFPIYFNPGKMFYAGGGCQAAQHYDGTTRFSVSHCVWARTVDWNSVWDGQGGGWVYPLVYKYPQTVFGSLL